MPGQGVSHGISQPAREILLTEIHDMISADGAVVDDDVPCPQGHGVPLQELRFLPSM